MDEQKKEIKLVIHEYQVCETLKEICHTLNEKTKTAVYYCGAQGSCGVNSTFFRVCPFPDCKKMVLK